MHGKGSQARRIPVEQILIDELAAYVDSSAECFAGHAKRRRVASGLAALPATGPCLSASDDRRSTQRARSSTCR